VSTDEEIGHDPAGASAARQIPGKVAASQHGAVSRGGNELDLPIVEELLI
jgi:hypothetical protein